jgi:hypothetical protein
LKRSIVIPDGTTIGVSGVTLPRSASDAIVIVFRTEPGS